MVKLKREECSVLPLILKGEWYRKIEFSDKREEYRTSKKVIREIEKWVGHGAILRKHLVVEFFLGYQEGRPSMAFLADVPVCRKGSIHPEWGEPEDVHYVIPLVGIGVELV